MILPIGTDRPRKKPTVVTYWLMALCAGVYLLQVVLQRADPEAFNTFMEAGALASLDRPWTLFTYQFLHGGLLHLAGNLLFLWVFGMPIEDRITRLGFLGFFLIGGAVAGVIHIVMTGHPVIGASGSISGVTGAFLVFFPRIHIRILLFFFIIGVYSIPAWWFIAFAIARDLFLQGLGGGSGVAHLAHLGGYAYGASLAFALLALKVVPREPAYDLFSLGRQAKRRRAFKEITSRGNSPWSTDAPRTSRVARTRDDEAQRRLAERRSAINQLISSGKAEQAMDAYEELLDDHPDTVLSKRTQLQIANMYYTAGRYENAALAYRLFEEHFPRDAELPNVRLMHALLCARYLNDPVTARRVLGRLDQARLDEPRRNLAETLRAELG